MKITSYIPPVCVVALVYLGYNYASNQTTTMRMLVDARKGLGTELSGLELTVKDLETERAAVSKSRADAMNANKDALVVMQKAAEDLAAAKRVLDGHKDERDEVLAKIKEGEATFEEIKAENEKMLAAMHNIPALANAELSEAPEILENTIKTFNEEYDQTNSDLEKKVAERDELIRVIGELTTDLRIKREINHRFIETYRKNGREYTIEAVDPQWHFVVFNAGEDSGLYPGDPVHLLGKRGSQPITTLRVVSVSGGKVVAEYDEKSLPVGLQIEVGDQVIRQKPFGS